MLEAPKGVPQRLSGAVDECSSCHGLRDVGRYQELLEVVEIREKGSTERSVE